MTKVSAYNGGLVSPTGYYKINLAAGQFTTFTYWWQARTLGRRGGRGAAAAARACAVQP